VRKNEDEESCVLACLREIRNCSDILGELHAGKVFDVLVLFVDKFCELSGFVLWIGLYHFLKDPHVDLGLVEGEPLAISPHDGRNRGTPVPASDDTDSVELIGGVLWVGDEGVVHWISHRIG